MIKIAHLITDLNIGGAEMMLFRLLGTIDRGRFDNIVICMLDRGKLEDSIRDIGIPVYTLRMSKGRPSISGSLRLYTILRRERPDILQTWLYHANLLGTIAGRLAGIRLIMWNLRSSILDSKTSPRGTILIMKLLAFLSALPNAIIVNSEAGKELHKKAGYRMSGSRVIFNGFDPDKFRPDADARIKIRKELGIGNDTILIGMIARFDPMKDHGTFMKAARSLLNKYPETHFLLAGNKVDLKNTALYDEVRATGAAGNFHLLGERSDVARIMASLDIAALSSISEGFANVVAEAMSCGIPCVVTDTGDSIFLIDKTGIVFPVKDFEALARAWDRLISMNKEERRALGALARKRIEALFSIKKIVAQYEALYARFAKGGT